ncbi:hypothetical protein NE865_05950 [Phthorimaea operculella]|nr:hypothetical protein NE865_05950 [Phthorimaea operculella]
MNADDKDRVRVVETSQVPMRPRCRIPQRLGSPRPKMPPSNRPVHTPPATPRPDGRIIGTTSAKQKVPAHRKTQNSMSVKIRQHTFSERSPWTGGCSRQKYNTDSPVPNQDTIDKLEQEELENLKQDLNRNKPEDMTIIKIQNVWKKHIDEFEALKRELDVQQKDVLKLYAALSDTHKAMSALGQEVSLPSIEDLRIMNVAKLTPNQLLKLCSDKRGHEESSSTKIMTVEMNKILEMPSKLVSTCELTLQKRMDIIEWFQTLKTEEKCISINKLTKKINEFIAENEMLAASLNQCKAEFMNELKIVVESLRNGRNENALLQERTEKLNDEVSKLIAQNTDLRKEVLTFEAMKFSPNTKHRIEELEKELKEEKCKKTVIKDRLTRAEHQVKTLNQRTSQMEAALDLARSQNWTLERTVQQLNDQNQKLQSDFDKELVKLTDSIKDNTVHLQEIAEARETLQTEKETLENRLQELSDSYNESLNKLIEELGANVKKLQDTEQKFEEETNERINLQSKLESLCSQLFEAEIRYKDVLKQMQVKDEELSNLNNVKCELEATSKSLESTKTELEDCKCRLLQQTQIIQEIENQLQEAIKSEKSLQIELKNKENYIAELETKSQEIENKLYETMDFDKSIQIELRNKEKYIAELEQKKSLLEDQLREREQKMETYEKQLETLKIEIAQVNVEFGDFDNMSQLRAMVNEQREKLQETTQQNDELTKALQQKELEMQNYREQLAERQKLLEQKDGVIKMISQKEQEQANITKLLRNNLELRAKADCELNQQISEKNAEIKSLESNLETRNEQISELEQIILTLEGQLQKVSLQRRRDRDKLYMLEKALTELEAIPDCKQNETPVDNLDHLIKILEDELGQFVPVPNDPPRTKKHVDEHKKLGRVEHSGDPERVEHYGDGRNNELKHHITEQDKPEPQSRKMDLQSSAFKDNLGRKKAITNMETQRWLEKAHPINFIYQTTLDKQIPRLKGTVPTVQVFAGQLDDKKGKMFKFAGHHL